jgi:hypothetical protein
VSTTGADGGRLKLGLHLADWPEADRRAWQAALAAAANPFARPSPGLAKGRRKATRPRPRTIRCHEEAFGVFAAFLARTLGEVGPSVVPHLTPESLEAYVADQRARGNRDVTIAKRLGNLRAALSRIAPASTISGSSAPGADP